MRLRPRRRWWFHVAWMRPGGGHSYRLYSESFPWFTARDRIAKAAWEFVRGEMGGDDFVIITLDFKPNRGRKPVGSYVTENAEQRAETAQ